MATTSNELNKVLEGIMQLLIQKQSLMEELQRQSPAGNQLAGVMHQQQQLLQSILDGKALGDLKLDGMKLPRFRGEENESFALYRKKCIEYLEARGVDINNPKLQKRLLALLGSTLDGPAGQMWVERSELIENVKEFFTTLQEEFVPHDWQRRLRRQLKDLKQRDCKNIADYISKFRNIILQVTDMTEVDKMTHFLDGLLLEVSEEVDFANPRNLKEAIQIALNYDRSHRRRQPRRPPAAVTDTAEPMEIDYVQSNHSKNGCWNCGKFGHKAANCRKNQGKNFGNNGNNHNKRFGQQQNTRQGHNNNNNRRPNNRGQNV